MTRSLALLVPGSLAINTGGYIYDRRMVDELRALGWSVVVHELSGTFPQPSPVALDDAARVLAGLADRQLVLVDGLAGGAMPRQLAGQATRLCLAALVHHPLAAETGLPADTAAQLHASERAALAAVRHVIVTSRTTAAALAEYGVPAARLSVVQPGTDRVPVATGSGTAQVELLCVATLTPRKGHDTLFAALAAMPPLSWHLTCVGSLDRDAATVARLRAQLAALGLGAQVSLAGETAAAGLAAYYSRADVFVLPTEYEGYGMAVADAVAYGLAVVSTPTGAIADIVPHGGGVLVPPRDVGALSAALTHLIADVDARARCAAAAILSRDRLPTWPVVALRMADALQRAVDDERIQH